MFIWEDTIDKCFRTTFFTEKAFIWALWDDGIILNTQQQSLLYPPPPGIVESEILKNTQ